ncbi:AAA family ATPase [Candidatus Daviesbacteria bacterium]|nr:AAA family ATPase [Candidatus Daviesbacteria bacterium]
MFKNIAVSGAIATGKSTLARNLAQTLGWQWLSAGEYFRKWHGKHKIPLHHSGKVPQELDKKFDKHFQNLMKNKEHVVFESHLAGFFAKDYPQTFKVLCCSELKTRIKRAAKEAAKSIKMRAESHRRKFKKLYGVENRLDESYFNLVVDTTAKTPEEVLQFVLKSIYRKS